GSSGNTAGATQSNGNLTNGSLANSDAPVQASDQDLQALNNSSGDSYEQAQKNLPSVIATSGNTVQPDNKAPGGARGSSDAQTVKWSGRSTSGIRQPTSGIATGRAARRRRSTRSPASRRAPPTASRSLPPSSPSFRAGWPSSSPTSAGSSTRWRSATTSASTW